MKYLLLLLGLSILLSACSNSSPVSSFDECVSEGFVAREGFPSSCSDGTSTFFDGSPIKQYVSLSVDQCSVLRFKCDEGLKPFFNDNGCGCEPINVTACTKEYKPVCGEVLFKCPEYPSCTPVKETFPNECAAENANAINLIEGVCEKTKGEDYCAEHGGKWIPKVNECEGVSRETCESIGGNFNGCASACRNDPEAEVCTMQCVQVCKL